MLILTETAALTSFLLKLKLDEIEPRCRSMPSAEVTQKRQKTERRSKLTTVTLHFLKETNNVVNINSILHYYFNKNGNEKEMNIYTVDSE